MILTFTRNAKKVLLNRISDKRNISIFTFDSFGSSVLMNNHQKLAQGLSFDDRIIEFINVLRSNKHNLNHPVIEFMQNRFFHIYVDEVQDLVGVRAAMVIEILKILPKDVGFTLLGDQHQGIYDFQLKNLDSKHSIYKTLDTNQLYFEFNRLNAKKMTLNKNFRMKNNQAEYVGKIRKLLDTGSNIDLKKDSTIIKLSKIPLSYPINNLIPPILVRNNGQALMIYKDFISQGNHNVRILTHTVNIKLPDWIGLLFHLIIIEDDNFDEDEIMELFDSKLDYDELTSQTIWNILTDPIYYLDDNSSMDFINSDHVLKLIKLDLSIDFNPNSSTNSLHEGSKTIQFISTIHKAKGLEFQEVIINIDSTLKDDEEKRIFYVGISRSKELAKLLDHKYKIIPPKGNKHTWYRNEDSKHFLEIIPEDFHTKSLLYPKSINFESRKINSKKFNLFLKNELSYHIIKMDKHLSRGDDLYLKKQICNYRNKGKLQKYIDYLIVHVCDKKNGKNCVIGEVSAGLKYRIAKILRLNLYDENDQKSFPDIITGIKIYDFETVAEYFEARDNFESRNQKLSTYLKGETIVLIKPIIYGFGMWESIR